MAVLPDYHQFAGGHWETGSVHNYYAYRNVTAPHTGRPYSEAFLLGVSGGITMGYFTFAYKGYDPQCNILTRNTFDPFDTMLSRLGVIQHIRHTGKPDKAVRNLVETLEEGVPAIVWADMWSLPYNALPADAGMWGMAPILVYGYDAENDTVFIADRAGRPLTVTLDELAAARARVKKDKHRLLTLDPPNPDKLASAAMLGITDCIKLFTEKPPKGSKNNFGLAAYRHWAKALTQPKQRTSWAKQFPPGLPLYAGLTSAYTFAFLFGKGLAEDGERLMYADFLEETAVLLQKPALDEVVAQFRDSAATWRKLAQALLPDDVPPLAQARQLLRHRHRLFLEQPEDALAEMQVIDAQLAAIRQNMVDDFPLTEGETAVLQENVAAVLLEICDIEAEAVAGLREAMG